MQLDECLYSWSDHSEQTLHTGLYSLLTNITVLLLFYFMCMAVLPGACRSLDLWACEPPHGWWKSNLGPLDEQLWVYRWFSWSAFGVLAIAYVITCWAAASQVHQVCAGFKDPYLAFLSTPASLCSHSFSALMAQSLPLSLPFPVTLLYTRSVVWYNSSGGTPLPHHHRS